VAAFNQLFADFPGKPTRQEMKLPERYPTNPQAEVLVFDKIETKYIIGAVVESSNDKATLELKYPTYQFAVCPHLFGPREDYEHWK